jgi:hypothetical protein|tara:strand:- start:1485 stop:1700 length:216 start_codon:yes stop_codon:yes gene_type:complete
MADLSDGWSKYEKMVIEKLDDHDTKFSHIEDKLTQIQVDIATLKVKAGIWGGIGGMIPAIIAIVLFYASKS